MSAMELDGIGIWSGELRFGDESEKGDAAAELEALGYTAAWIPDVGGDVFGAVGSLLGATSRMVIATGILNIWMHEPEETATRYHELVTQHGPRFLVGLGVSHAPLIDMKGPGTYAKPLAKMRDYLDGVDHAERPLPVDARVLAALGPKMLELARDRAGGAHPYLANPDHTRFAREVLGPEPLLAPEQPVVLETDPGPARELARKHLSTYLGLPNYVNNLLRLGLTEDDVRDGGSDRLVDSIVAWGDETAIASRVQAHRDAGADHVCIQLLTGDFATLPLEGWRRLSQEFAL